MTGIPAFGFDALSSAAYGPEAAWQSVPSLVFRSRRVGLVLSSPIAEGQVNSPGINSDLVFLSNNCSNFIFSAGYLLIRQ
jgi:hypothetical protein